MVKKIVQIINCTIQQKLIKSIAVYLKCLKKYIRVFVYSMIHSIKVFDLRKGKSIYTKPFVPQMMSHKPTFMQFLLITINVNKE